MEKKEKHLIMENNEQIINQLSNVIKSNLEILNDFHTDNNTRNDLNELFKSIHKYNLYLFFIIDNPHSLEDKLINKKAKDIIMDSNRIESILRSN